MLNKFQDKAQKVIALSESIAFELGQSSVGTEHLLLALLKQKDNKCRQLLEKEGISYTSMYDNVVSLFGKKANKPFYMEYTTTYKKVLENAITLSRKKQEDKVSIDSLSVAMMETTDCVAHEILNKNCSN